MNHFTEAAVTIGLAIIGLAMVSVLVSRNAQTPALAQAVSSGFGNVLGEAISPVTGAGATPDLSYPGGGSFSSHFGF